MIRRWPGELGPGDEDPQEPLRPAPWIARLSPTDIELLERIADGLTVKAAAKDCFVSLRTANRRLREVRALIGATTTRELVAAYRHGKNAR